MADLAERFAQASNASVVAAAGCGKTELIARAVKVGSGRQLVLTHTHAGVNALRARMRKYQVPTQQYAIETIDGWSLKFAASFPEISQIETTQPVDKDWLSVRQASSRLLGNRNICQIIAFSYDGVYVDEYQDCTIDQHVLVSRLAELLPIRVVGDPLQGIFSFADNQIVSWKRDVFDVFPLMERLTTPYRWQGVNEDLGGWLSELRQCIYEDRELDLVQAPIRWQQGSARQCRFGCTGCTLCQSYPSHESVILFKKWPSTCRDAARTTGRYQAIEEMACKRLLKFATNLGTRLGSELALGELGRSVSLCFTRKDEIFECPEVREALAGVASSGELNAILSFLETVEACGIGRRYCSDLWFEAKRAIQMHVEEPQRFGSLGDAAWAAREQTRRIGRRLPRRLASTTLLVKGLEFDHSLIAEADYIRTDRQSKDPWLGAKNFYVAGTRALRSLTVFSSSPVISRWKA